MKNLLSYEEVITYLEGQKEPISLLSGNGFGVAYDSNIFSYNALFNNALLNSFSEKDKLEKLYIQDVSKVRKEEYIECIMKALEDPSFSIHSSGCVKREEKELKKSAFKKFLDIFLESIFKLHPKHGYKISDEEACACAKFLKFFIESGGQIFTTNYDLLHYWVSVRANIGIKDGFSPYLDNRLGWKDNVKNQTFHFMHGALHLFRSGKIIEKERYDSGVHLVKKIENRIKNREYPLIIMAGDSNQKLDQIKRIPYLTYCYNKLSSLGGYLVTYGFRFGESDYHIIDAINAASSEKRNEQQRLKEIYIGVYSDEDINHIELIKSRFHIKVKIFDAKTANVWGLSNNIASPKVLTTTLTV